MSTESACRIAPEFPGDFRPLLRTDLRQIRTDTYEARHTADWLLLQASNVFLEKIRRMPPNEAWRQYALLAEKIGLSAEEAAERAAASRGFPPPDADTLGRFYVGRAPGAFSFISGSVIAEGILPHLKLSPLEARGLRAPPHKILLLADDGKYHAWQRKIPEAWQPNHVADVSFVAVVGPAKEELLQTCLYNGPSISRYRCTLRVRLHDARTGALFAEELLEDVARPCQASERFDLSRLGYPISYEALWNWVAQKAGDAAMR